MIKKGIFIIMLTGILFSCSKTRDDNSENELLGRWKLTEVLADPGDGSGTFHPVNSDKTIEFHSDGSITSNGSLQDMSVESGSPSSGTYSVADSTIHPSDWDHPAINIHYLQSGAVLILFYPCIEPCQAKYEKQ